jgi:hypothetical protein
MDVIDGPSNDVVKVYIDGALVHTGTSWENYYRYDSEASAEQSPRIGSLAVQPIKSESCSRTLQAARDGRSTA